MRPQQMATTLASFEGRGAGTDSERRAAQWLAAQLETGGRSASVETFWCRPNWALAHAWHALLGLAGSLVAVHSARVGGAMVLVALLSLTADEVLGVSLGRRLTPERASQNVLSTPEPPRGGEADVRLILTANLDMRRQGLILRRPLRSLATGLRRIVGPVTPGWSGWLLVALVWLLAVALVRLSGDHGTLIGVVQLPPTVALVLGLVLLLEQGTASFGPGEGDSASAVAVALALARSLDVAPPRRLSVELLLQGAGDVGAVGLRRHLRRRRPKARASDTIVLGIAPCAAGSTVWWAEDGALLPGRYFRHLRRLCAQVAGESPDLDGRPYRGRGHTPALPARVRLPAITIGSRERRPSPPRSSDASAAPNFNPGALDDTLQFGLLLIDAIDAYLAEHRPAPRAAPPEAVGAA